MKRLKRIGRIAVIPLVILVLVIGCVFIVKIAFAEPLDTYHSEWQLVRETADEDGASFSAVYDLTGVSGHNGNFAGKDSNSVANGGPFHISSRGIGTDSLEGYSSGTKWMFVFCGKNYNNVDDTFSFNLVGWSKTNGMLQNICEGDCVLGTQAVVIYPDGGDALGELISETGVTYTHNTKTFTDTSDTGAFDGAVAGMLARVTSDGGFTDAITQITTVTDANIFICSGLSSTADKTNATVQVNPAFWVDTINVDEITKWSSVPDANSSMLNVGVINSGDNEVACLIVDLAGIEWIQFVIYEADAATSEESGDITVYGRPR